MGIRRHAFWIAQHSQHFQRLMNKVFAKEVNSFILLYLDDIFIFSRSIGENWDHLNTALERLRRAKLYGRLHKCEFLKAKVDYLGFEVRREFTLHLKR